MLRPASGDWQIAYVASGAEALATLNRQPFDAVVTAVQLPDQTAPELMRAVMQQHPKAVRLVLAAAAEQPRVMECAAFTHQFLTRPCELEVFRVAIDRATDLEASMRRELVGRLVGRMDRLPSLPDLYVQLVDKMNQPECSIDEVGDLVARDISMTARILKLVNSAFFGLRHRVSSPHEAVNYLGLDTVKALVLSINAFAQFERLSLGGVSLEALWNHSLMTAGCAKVIAEFEESDARQLDEIFVAGMLHDAGKLALAANFHAEYGEVVRTSGGNPSDVLAAEEVAFGATHAEVGGYLLGMWGLPGPVVDAVSWHHEPLRCSEQAFGPLACVHVANIWVNEVASGYFAPLAREYYEQIGMAERLPEWRRVCLEAHLAPSAAEPEETTVARGESA